MAESSSGGPKGPGRIQKGKAPSATAPTKGADATEHVDAVDHARAAEGADAASAVERTGPVTAPPSTEALDAVVATLAAELRAGKITIEQAVSTLVDDAIERQVRAALTDAPDLEGELRTVLRRHLAEDPFLLAKVRRLHQAK